MEGGGQWGSGRRSMRWREEVSGVEGGGHFLLPS